jgi:hypothetical protein
VAVRYRPEQPETAELDPFWHVWLQTVVFAVLGGAFLLVGLGFLVGLVPA